MNGFVSGGARIVLAAGVLIGCAALPASAQPAGKFPPDSLHNVQALPPGTPVQDVVGMMRGFTGALGVRCTYCHVGQEGQPLEAVDFVSDEKRTKVVAREMMRMVQEINGRLAALPDRPSPHLDVTCTTCHRGVTRPMPLGLMLGQAVSAAGADSAAHLYRGLRERYYGRSAYDFGEQALPSTAYALIDQERFEDALALLRLNEEFYPESAGTQAIVGDVHLAAGDTTAAVAAYRVALQRDPEQRNAKRRLRELGLE